MYKRPLLSLLTVGSLLTASDIGTLASKPLQAQQLQNESQDLARKYHPIFNGQ